MPKVLMIAFHYPPYQGGSGVHRTLKFSRYLPEFEWNPIVLSTHPRAYPQAGDDRLSEIPQDIPIKRAFAFDSARHLAICGRYFNWTALPDRWVSWFLGAVPAGLKLIRKYQPDVLWSTYPIATAHLIGLVLHRLSGIPWVADFRDVMSEGDYPGDPAVRNTYFWIERQTLKFSRRAVLTTPGALRLYAQRYPWVPKSHLAVITNGYDETDFVAAEKRVTVSSQNNGKIVLVHSGVLYPSERDPTAFFSALRTLRQAGKISSSNLRIVLRGSGSEVSYMKRLLKDEIQDIVFLEPEIPYKDALAEMLMADGLLLFQASNCNHQIPAKIYEYLRARRPIFALTDPVGDTAELLKSTGITTFVPLDSRPQIADGLLKFLSLIKEGRAPLISKHSLEYYSRRYQSQQLAALMGSLSLSEW